MHNFFYAADKNYNYQLYISILSLLDKVSEKINIYVLHKDPDTFLFLEEKILKESMLNKLEISKFDDSINFDDYPSLENSHVSEVTYYRFFMDKFLTEEVEFVTYLDADIVCINDPIKELDKITNDLKVFDLPIAGRTIGLRMERNKLNQSSERLNKIKMLNDRYFSAGVLTINYKQWVNNNIFNKLIDLSKELENHAEYHDQDVLNSHFDSNYLELNEFMNLRVGKNANYFNNKYIYKHAIFLHYEGNWKPWTIKGILKESSYFYTEYFRTLNIGSYHITHNRKWNSFKDVINGIFSKRLYSLDKTFKFLQEAISIFFTRNN